jgi:hypothetical protein
MTNNFTDISHLIKSQFPQFYLEEGPDLVTFVEEYYKWAETEGGLEKSRNLLTNRDIDETADKFLSFFRNKYMAQLPDVLIADKRELQKHILDLYRSKGSEAGLRLLFRLLYGEDIEIYIPSYDILKASDGDWVQEKYLELTKMVDNYLLQGKFITGFESGAQAFVEDYREISIKGRIVNIAVIQNVSGDFIPGELIIYEGLDFAKAPKILGSPIEGGVITSISGIPLNTVLAAEEFSGRGVGAQAVVTETFVGSGIIRFTLVNGGTGYSLDADISITSDANTSGSDASFVIESLSNTSIFFNNDNIVSLHEDVLLDSNTFSFGVGDDSTLATANLDTIISNGIIIEEITVGTIDKIRTINPGTNYDGSVTVTITDPYTVRLDTLESDGSLRGNNAIVTGLAEVGTVVSRIRISDSGYGYNDPDQIITFRSIDDPDLFLETRLTLGGVGQETGRWASSKGFLNADKYIQDSFFYQEYSYEIFSSRTLSRYIDVLRNVTHPAGNKPFGRAVSLNRGNLVAKPLIEISIDSI